jgi:dienelactone hydrolase
LRSLAGAPEGQIYFETGPFDRVTGVVWGFLSLPKNRHGPVPAMVVSHGSGGLVDQVRRYASVLNPLGVATFMVDHFAPRNVRETATDQARVSAADMALDALRARRLLATHPGIDGSRIGIMGFSKGGNVAWRTAVLQFHAGYIRAGHAFSLHVVFYPGGCQWQPERLSQTRAPMLFLLGSRDTFTPPEPCAEYAQRLTDAGYPVTLKVYDDAEHGWDGVGPDKQEVLRDAEHYHKCSFFVLPNGALRDRKTGSVYTAPGEQRAAERACTGRGVTRAPNARVRAMSDADVMTFLRMHFGL